jgi:regulator of sirC expression with transglutaminase-like and TPR domain
MNELLLSEINTDDIDLLNAVALVEKFIFEHQVNIDYIEKIAQHCFEELSDNDDMLDRAEQLINEIYVHQLFIDNARSSWTVASHQLNDAIAYRIISPILKSVFLKYIISYCGFEVDIVFIPEKVMIRIICDNDYSIIFEPVTGESLTWHDLDERMADNEGDPSEQHIDAIENKDVVYKYIESLKNTLIHEQKFDKALKCVDILLAMRPDDPFERRDRGFLLHQLDCFKVAYDDYRYFVEQCPQDPAAQLLKLQLDQISIANMVLH